MKNALLTILLFFWKMMIHLPMKMQNILSIVIGYLMIISSFKRNKISKVNIELCFPELSEKNRNRIYKDNVFASSKAIFHSGIAWFWSDKKIQKSIPYKINGLDNLLKNQDSKKGILLFFKHSLHLELDSRILAMNAEIYGVEREHNSEKFELTQSRGRLKSLKGLAGRKNTITFMRWLKNGKTVLYAPDQDYGMKNSIVVDFFGIPAATVSAPLKIIKSANCMTFFLNSYFDKGKLIIDLEEIELSDKSVEEFSNELNMLIETKIKLHPSEYLWQHRRFKSTLGKESIYK